MVEHIFGEFNQIEDQANRRYEGTGLGLAITRQLVRLMGGTTWVDSVPGEGSCFGFRVTLDVAEPDEPRDAPGRPILLRRALIVEEARLDRVILERQLRGCGLEVAICQGMEEARAAVGGAAFDVILVDGDLPGIDLATLAVGSGSCGAAGAPVLVMVADPSAWVAAADSVAGVLPKPVLRAQLFRALQALSCHDRGGTSRSPGAAEAARQAGGLRRMRVLAAEDNRTNRLVLRKMVADFDIDLRFASDGREAVEAWADFRPDLVFMDISMPEMDGREATRAIRADEAERGLPRVPVVALTAHAMEGDGASILAAGLDHYLTKPLRKAAIAEAIGRFCPAEARPALAADGVAGSACHRPSDDTAVAAASAPAGGHADGSAAEHRSAASAGARTGADGGGPATPATRGPGTAGTPAGSINRHGAERPTAVAPGAPDGALATMRDARAAPPPREAERRPEAAASIQRAHGAESPGAAAADSSQIPDGHGGPPSPAAPPPGQAPGRGGS